MKKNIILGISVVLTVLSIMYGYLQRIEAEKQGILAEEAQVKVEKCRGEAESQRLAAEFSQRKAEEAIREAMIANDELERSLRKK